MADILSAQQTGFERVSYSRTQSYHDLTTRIHYSSTHGLAVVINGVEMKTVDFEVVAV